MAKSEERREPITAETVGLTSELAALLGLTTRRVQQLNAEGILPAVSKGRYLLSASVQAYLAHRLGDALSPEELSIERRRREAETVLKEAKAKIAHYEAEELEGNYHRSEDVELFVGSLIYEMKDLISALPGRLAVDVAATDNPAECAELIKAEVREVLNSISEFDYDPEMYAEKVRERRRWRDREPGEPEELDEA